MHPPQPGRGGFRQHDNQRILIPETDLIDPPQARTQLARQRAVSRQAVARHKTHADAAQRIVITARARYFGFQASANGGERKHAQGLDRSCAAPHEAKQIAHGAPTFDQHQQQAFARRRTAALR